MQQCITDHCAAKDTALPVQRICERTRCKDALQIICDRTCTRAVRGALPLNALGREAVTPWAPSSGVMASAFAILVPLPGLSNVMNAPLGHGLPRPPALSLCQGWMNYSTMRLQIWQGSGGPLKALHFATPIRREQSPLQWLPLC